MTTISVRACALSAVLLLTVAIPSPAEGPEEIGLVVKSEAGVTTFRLDAAEPFHRTGNTVIGERLIDLANSSVRVALWTEVVDGGEQPFYAISLDGRSMATVRRTSYELALRHGDFDPVVETLPVEPMLAAAETANLHLVQFVTQPLEEYRAAVTALGGTVQKFIANHAHFVQMNPQVRDAVAALPFVRWVGPVHPAYKLEAEIREQILTRAEIAPRRYSIMLHERGPAAQDRVVERIEAIGGEVHGSTPQGYRIEATLSLTQVRGIADLDDVMFVDRKGAIELDMDIVRSIGGADYLETIAGFTGQGVRAEIADSELDVNHPEWSAPPIIHVPGSSINHGTSVYGILFAQGADPQARGLIPDGVGIFSFSEGFLGGGPTRYEHTAELVDPFGPYRTVLQTNSTGDFRTFFYTTISAEMDDMLFIYDMALTQSQSNAGNQDSRPQAWAKNIISCGAVNHYDTETRDDDCWCNTGSIGPADDGRIKPDLSFFYDDTYTSTAGGGYTQFGGTSGATPSVAGYLGLFFQMWSEEVFGNEVPDPGGTVFENRPHMTTAKAAMINTASPWDFTGTGDDLTRVHQGWGMPDIQYLYDIRDKIAFIDETELLTNLDSVEFVAVVQPGEPELRATMVYADPMGTPGAGVHRINDLTLKLTSPSEIVYWGNNGLLEGNWSVPGGDPNSLDTVENVFVQNPEAGVWEVAIIADEINEDGHTETPELDADFALAVSGGNLAICSSEGRVRIDRALYACGDEVEIRVVDCDLNTSDTTVESVVVTLASTTEPGGETVLLTETAAESADFRGTISLDTANAAGVLQVSEVDVVTASYTDADDGQGGTNLLVQDAADVDCVPPVISNVQAMDITGQGATITWETDEPADRLVTYGLVVPDQVEAVSGSGTAHTVALGGLEECTVYVYSVTSVDEAGNSATHDNLGAYHTFETGKNVQPIYPTLEPPVSIPDNSPTGAEQSIVVTDEEEIVDVDVEVNVTHTFTGDLELSLIGPDGTEVVLSDRNGGGGNNFSGTIFDDEAGTSIGSGSAPFTGSFSPDGLLSAFDGKIVTGQWRLRVEDHAGADLGTIDSWSLRLTYPPRECGPHMRHQSHTIDDDCAGFGSGGAGNGIVEAGEDIVLDVRLRNDGNADLTDISAVLSSATPGVTITQGFSSYPDLTVGEAQESSSSPFAFTVDAGLPCGTPIVFDLDAGSNEGQWLDDFTVYLGGSSVATNCIDCFVLAPGVVSTLGWGDDKESLEWTAASRAAFYELHRGDPADLQGLLDATVDSCNRLTTSGLGTGNVLNDPPAVGSLFWYLVRAGNGGGDGPGGNATAGPRVLDGQGVCP